VGEEKELLPDRVQALVNLVLAREGIPQHATCPEKCADQENSRDDCQSFHNTPPVFDERFFRGQFASLVLPGNVRQGRGGKKCGRGFVGPFHWRKNLSQEVCADAHGSERRPSPAELLGSEVQRAGDDGIVVELDTQDNNHYLGLALEAIVTKGCFCPFFALFDMQWSD